MVQCQIMDICSKYHIPYVPNSSNTNVQRPNDFYFNQILEKHKKDLAVMFKETFGVELKDSLSKALS